MIPFKRVSVRLRTAIGAALLAAAAVPALPLAGQCALGFLDRTAPVIDGQNSGDWSDASVISSSSAAGACLSQLLDQSLVLKNVTVYSKRYFRSGQPYIGMMFEVQDATSTGSGGGLLTNGERIAVQIENNASGGSTLGSDDYRLVVTHRWESSASDPQDVTNVQSSWSVGTLPAGVCGGGPRWQESTLPASYSARVRKDYPGGYRLELELPAAAVGGIGGNFRVAFQVINDWGSSGDPNSAAASFPASLPYSTLDNAVNGCNDGWRTPDDWALAYFSSAPTDVYISRSPVFWNSEDILALACGTPSYEYHATSPCRLTLRAQLRKTAGGDETRNILFLWADHGASPANWRVIGLKEGVTVSGVTTTTESAPWSGVPTGLPNHPCVRVYILPPFFQAAFDRADILAISTPAQLDSMVNVYAVQTQHWAQKNISAATTQPNCPVAGCGIGGMFPSSTLAFGASLGQALTDLALPRPLAAASVPEGAVRAVQDRVVVTGQQRPAGRPILLSKMDRGVLEGRNAVVQVQSIGWVDQRPTAGDSLGYVLAEPLGGFFQVIPLGLLSEKDSWPLRFVVGNPGTHARQVFLTMDTEVPAGAPPVYVRVDTMPHRMEPNGQAQMQGAVSQKPFGGGGPGCPFRGGGMAVGLGLVILGVVVRRRKGA